MPKTLIKSGSHSKKQKIRFRLEMNRTKSNLPLHLQSFKQKLLSRKRIIVYKWA